MKTLIGALISIFLAAVIALPVCAQSTNLVFVKGKVVVRGTAPYTGKLHEFAGRKGQKLTMILDGRGVSMSLYTLRKNFDDEIVDLDYIDDKNCSVKLPSTGRYAIEVSSTKGSAKYTLQVFLQ